MHHTIAVKMPKRGKGRGLVGAGSKENTMEMAKMAALQFRCKRYIAGDVRAREISHKFQCDRRQQKLKSQRAKRERPGASSRFRLSVRRNLFAFIV